MADNPLQVGHYKLLKTLGIGAFGKVKLGKHVVTGHLVSVWFACVCVYICVCVYFHLSISLSLPLIYPH